MELFGAENSAETLTKIKYTHPDKSLCWSHHLYSLEKKIYPDTNFPLMHRNQRSSSSSLLFCYCISTLSHHLPFSYLHHFSTYHIFSKIH